MIGNWGLECVMLCPYNHCLNSIRIAIHISWLAHIFDSAPPFRRSLLSWAASVLVASKPLLVFSANDFCSDNPISFRLDRKRVPRIKKAANHLNYKPEIKNFQWMYDFAFVWKYKASKITVIANFTFRIWARQYWGPNCQDVSIYKVCSIHTQSCVLSFFLKSVQAILGNRK